MTTRFAGACMAALLSAAACASMSGPHVIYVRDLPERPVYTADWMTTDRAAAAVAMAVMHRELRLPRLDVTMYFVPDRDALRQALIEHIDAMNGVSRQVRRQVRPPLVNITRILRR